MAKAFSWISLVRSAWLIEQDCFSINVAPLRRARSSPATCTSAWACVSQEEKTVLQEALGQSDQHLQQAYREMETLRLQLEHVRLAPGALNPSG